jgi:carbon storage regulator
LELRRDTGEEDAMLFLTRKVGESIVINDDIEVTVVEVRGKSIKLGFTFPPEAKVLRRELHDRIKAESQNKRALVPAPEPDPTS